MSIFWFYKFFQVEFQTLVAYSIQNLNAAVFKRQASRYFDKI